MWTHRRALVGVLLVAVATPRVLGKSYIVNNPEDEGGCVFGGKCDLRGAWNMAVDGDDILVQTNCTLKSPLGEPMKASQIILHGDGNSGAKLFVVNGREETGYHREFIRWTNFNASNGLVLADLTISGFSSSQPGGRNVQEFGGAINLGCAPQEGGYRPPYCRNKLDTPAVTNVVFGDVEFASNIMRSSSPRVNDQFGAAVAVCCEGCGVDFRQTAFLKNVLPFDPDEVQAGGAIFTDVSMTTVTGSVFKGNGFGRLAGKGADVFACGPLNLADSNFTGTLTHGGSAVQSEHDLTISRCTFAPAAETKLTVLEAGSIEVLNSEITLNATGPSPLRACYSGGHISMERTSFKSTNGAVIELKSSGQWNYIWNKYPGEGFAGLTAPKAPFAACSDQLDACNPLQKCLTVYNTTGQAVGWRCT